MRVQRTLPGPEDIGSPATDHLPYHLPAVASLAHDLLDGHAILRQSQDGRIGLLAAGVAFILEPLGAVSSLESIVVAPMTVRIWRIDLQTASRKARLTFSFRCYRSATCIACGRAFAAASPYPPRRSRATVAIEG
jgi:hypothetical protein